MRHLKVLATAVVLTFATRLSVSAQSPTEIVPTGDAESLKGYKLAWHDEFDGHALNTDEWDYRTDSKHWSTQQPENVTVADGTLRLALKKEPVRGKAYTGGGIISKKRFQYGYYEARFRIPPGKGWHTSFWTMNYDKQVGTTKPPAAQEIDICEQDSIEPTGYSAGVIAWGNAGKGLGRQYFHHLPNLASEFHVWGCEFTPEKVNFFFDGQLTHSTDASKFKQGEQNIWLTAIASYLGKTDKVDDTTLPAVAEFDYVRYFEKPTPG